jgi:HEAT repeat protein
MSIMSRIGVGVWILWIGSPLVAEELILQGQDLPYWIKKLESKEESERQSAAKVLRDCDSSAKSFVPRFIQLLKDEDAEIRRDIAFALGKIGAEAKEAAKPLADLLNDDSFAVRYTAALSLGRIGPPAKEALPALEAAFKDINTLVIIKVSEAIVRIEPKKSPIASKAILSIIQSDSESEKNKTEAAIVLGRWIPTEGKPAIPLLTKGCKSSDPYVAIRCIEALGKCDSSQKMELIHALIKRIDDANELPRVRVDAIVALMDLDFELARKRLKIVDQYTESNNESLKATAKETKQLLNRK